MTEQTNVLARNFRHDRYRLFAVIGTVCLVAVATWLVVISKKCRQVGEEREEQGMTFIRICPGTFMMGSTAHQDEIPLHEVTLREFWIGKYEVTNAQFRLFRTDHKGDDQLPATRVTWYEAKGFCERFGYRLPTEAEWEYAARAGAQTRWSFGDKESYLGRYAWYWNNSDLHPHPVGTRKPNLWGLYDMHGNVWEWVLDCYQSNYNGAPTDGSARKNDKCELRVLRGGSFDNWNWFVRSAYRERIWPIVGVRDAGFRCAYASDR